MSSEIDINAVCRSWRRGVKQKFRGIASFAERAADRFRVIEERMFSRRVPIAGWEIRYLDYRGWGDAPVIRDWEPVAVGAEWGEHGPSVQFRTAVTVPEEFDGDELMLRLYVGGDSLLHVDGAPWHGMDPFRHNVFFLDAAAAGESHELLIDTYAHYHAPRADHRQAFALAELAAVDRPVWDAYYDLWCASKLLDAADLDARLREYVEHHLWEALKLVPVQVDDEAAVREAIAAARARIRETVYAGDRFRGAGLQHLVGHSHLDVVFMWQHKEYLRKVGRTHATMLRLMERYPEFKFSQSQAKLYADMKACYPELFEQVKARVIEGRWEPLGAFWVEPDCNLISGESFVRQILHGQRFFEREFGMRSRTCWQPDVFGISWGLPQILASAGIEFFMTAKMIAWNDTNPWIRHTFWWEGPDGSRVLGIVPPGHFIGTVDPDMMDKQWRGFSDKYTVGETLHVYGWGDGGGGVDIEMLESAKRYGDFPGLVPTCFSTVEEAFDSIKNKALVVPDLPVHRDELYLEAHRGSVTSKGRLKRLNRSAEWLYREAEMLAAMAWAGGAAHPDADLDAGWKAVLEAQFHDAVPGTHVTAVYRDLLDDYARIFRIGEGVRAGAAAALLGGVDGEGLAVFNALAGERAGVEALESVDFGEALVADPAGAVLPQQEVLPLDGGRRRLVAVPAVPGTGWRGLRLVPAGPAPDPEEALAVDERHLENALLRAEIDDRGRLASLFDKEHGREVLAGDRPGNVFELFEDRPGKYEAWDIVATYAEHPIAVDEPARVTVDERGPLRVALRIERAIAASTLVQRVSLAAGSRRLDFETEIDWVERQRLLKVGFPVAVNAERATYDIAFATIQRSAHRNSPTDEARFEVNAHQWMDLSQHDYGVSVLNDGKYGCDVLGDVMRLTLLKGSIHPDPEADKEVHHFTYSIWPHPGDWREGGTLEAARRLNHGLFARRCPLEAAAAIDGSRPVAVDGEGVTVEALKRADAGEALVLRLLENRNAAVHARVRLPGGFARAFRCGIMEEGGKELPATGGLVELDLRPCELATLRLER